MAIVLIMAVAIIAIRVYTGNYFEALAPIATTPTPLANASYNPLLHPTTLPTTVATTVTETPTPTPTPLPSGRNVVGPGESIQSTINRASDGDTITVLPGVYHERLLLNRPITLVGIDNPVIDAQRSGSVITIASLGCTVDGFTIENSAIAPNAPDADYAGIRIYSNLATVKDCIIRNNQRGVAVVLLGVSNTIQNNTITGNIDDGIYLDTQFNSILKNNITNNTNGIHVELTQQNLIEGNHILDNRDHGIYLHLSSENVLLGNTVTGNRNDGITIIKGRMNTVQQNTVMNNVNNGIYYEESWDPDIFGDQLTMYSDKTHDSVILNIVKGNTVGNNRYGIHTLNATCWIGGNAFVHNVVGVHVIDTAAFVYDNRFDGNWFGVDIEDSLRNVVRGNTFEKAEYGVRFLWNARNNLVAGNRIVNCTYAFGDESRSLTNVFSDNTVVPKVS
jgi:nitrous oxidase accessory protein